MKSSELRAKLLAIEQEHGDLEVEISIIDKRKTKNEPIGKMILYIVGG